LLCKIGAIAKKFANYMNDKLSDFNMKPMEVNLKGIKARARRYFFAKRNIGKAEKNKLLSDLLEYVSKEVRLVIDNGRCMGQQFIDKMPWYMKGIFQQLIEKGRKYLLDVKSFLETGNMVPDKILSFHLNKVCCITKNKPGKK
jgi:hypothetical protein